MAPQTRAGGGGGDDDDGPPPTLLSIVELNKLFKDVTIFTPQSGVHDGNKALFRSWTRSIKASALYAQLGVTSRPRPSERHCEAAERTNRAVYGLTRAMMHAGSVPDNLWEDAACQDAGRAWFELLSHQVLDVMGFQRHPVDRCLFCKAFGQGVVYVLAYVDDLLVIGTPRHQASVIDDLKAAFPMTEGGEDYLGLQFQVEPGRVRVHQAEYASKICAKFGFARASSVKTPLSTDWNAGNTEQPSGGRPGRITRDNMDSALGAIGYLATRTMPWLTEEALLPFLSFPIPKY
jgi:hypothetical protein